MDLIRSTKKRRNPWLDLLHATFNVAFAAAILGLIIWFPESWYAAILVVLAKWRTLAVRPRYWWANILSNLPDLLLGVGVTILMWGAGTLSTVALPTQIALAAFYAVWLVYIKPQHKKHFILIQAGVSQFIALSALFFIAYMMPVWAVILVAFVIGFSSARQAFGAFEEKHKSFLASLWGLVVAELTFVLYHWTIAYQITASLYIPAAAIIIALLGFVMTAVYESYQKHAYVVWKDIKMPVAFAAVALLIILLLFNGLWDATSL
jgi:hypothetical protein